MILVATGGGGWAEVGVGVVAGAGVGREEAVRMVQGRAGCGSEFEFEGKRAPRQVVVVAADAAVVVVVDAPPWVGGGEGEGVEGWIGWAG